jgi:large repetitive protein
MRARSLGLLMVGLVLVLAACGRVSTGPGAAESPSPSPLASPSASPLPTPLAIPGPAFHEGEVGIVYSPVTINATGGNPPYLWNITSGTLPGGLTLSIDGTITGTPTTSGAFTFTAAVLDANLAAANLSGTITIVPRLTVYHVGAMAGHNEMEVCVEAGGNNPCPASDDRYSAFAAVGGGAGPYTYTLLSGTLPPGTRLNGLALTGDFGHSYVGVVRFTVAVTDSMGATATINAIYNLYRLQPH